MISDYSKPTWGFISQVNGITGNANGVDYGPANNITYNVRAIFPDGKSFTFTNVMPMQPRPVVNEGTDIVNIIPARVGDPCIICWYKQEPFFYMMESLIFGVCNTGGGGGPVEPLQQTIVQPDIDVNDPGPAFFTDVIGGPGGGEDPPGGEG